MLIALNAVYERKKFKHLNTFTQGDNKMKKTIVTAIAVTAFASFILAGVSNAGPKNPHKPGFQPNGPTYGTSFSPIWKPSPKSRALIACKKKFQGINITHVVYSQGKWQCWSKDFHLGSL